MLSRFKILNLHINYFMSEQVIRIEDLIYLQIKNDNTHTWKANRKNSNLCSN